MSAHSARTIDVVVVQYAENAAALRAGRTGMVRSRRTGLLHLSRHDERLEANLDGLAVAGHAGARVSLAALERPEVGEAFVAAFCAIRHGDRAATSRLLSLAETLPEAFRGISSLLGWLSAQQLRALIPEWLGQPGVMARTLAIGACAAHRVDPGTSLVTAVEASEADLARKALQAAGEIGRIDLLPQLLARLQDADEVTNWHAARAALLLGDRDRALSRLRALALQPGPRQRSALCLAVLASSIVDARQLMRTLGQQDAPGRLQVEAAGWTGDPAAVPWLLRQMDDDILSRAAGEAFGMITGADLSSLDLDRKSAEPASDGPDGDADAEDIEQNPDGELLWPDAEKVRSWWGAHSHRFTHGCRAFVGAPPAPTHLIEVLKGGSQFQRAAAAAALVLDCPGRPLFNIAAPAGRQKALLAAT